MSGRAMEIISERERTHSYRDGQALQRLRALGPASARLMRRGSWTNAWTPSPDSDPCAPYG